MQQGEQFFAELSCATCHQPKLRTGSLPGVPEVEDQTIYPYTDLLLHDMGPAWPTTARCSTPMDANGALRRSGASASPSSSMANRAFCTTACRARTFTEAILWHGGEAEAAREGFKRLTESEHDALLAFLKSL